MSITVGWNTAQAVGITREEMDQWSFESHQKAIAAIDAGRMSPEIVPVKVPSEAYTLMSVAAVVLGGVSLAGGRGGVFGPIVAVVILQIIRTDMTAEFVGNAETAA